MFRKLIPGLVFCGVMVCPLVALASSLKVQEELLGQKSDADPFDEWDIVSPDAERVAWRERVAKRWVVKVNGDPLGPQFDEIDSVAFSPDGEHVAYLGKQGKNWRVVVDGKPGATYPEIEWFIFSTDSKRIAYKAKRGDDWVAVVDGKPGPAYREIGTIHFSPDSERVAYPAKKGDKWVTVLDGQEGKQYDDVGSTGRIGSKYFTFRSLVFSSDSRHLAYPAKRNKRWVLVVDGKEHGPEMRNVFDVLGFDPENETPIYVGRIGRKGWSLFRDYVPGPEFDIIALPDFSRPAGAPFAYAGARARGNARAKGQVVVDGVSGPEFEGSGPGPGLKWFPGVQRQFSAERYGVSSPSVSPDGQHVAYGARHGKNDFVAFLDGEPGPSFEHGVCNPSFAPDGKLFYGGVGETMVFLMVDGVKAGEFAWEGRQRECGPAFFTKDGAHSAFIALRFRFSWTAPRVKRRLVVDGRPGPEYDARGLGDVRFFSEGEEFHFAYVVWVLEENEEDVSFVVVDGLEGQRYDRVMFRTLRFVDSDTVTFTAQRGRSFYRVTHALPSPPTSTEE